VKNKISWSAASIRQFSNAIDYIRLESEQNAESVYAKAINKLNSVVINPTSCPPDKYKVMNDGTFRAFVVDRHRISYRIKKNEIRVLRVRHSSMKPKYF